MVYDQSRTEDCKHFSYVMTAVAIIKIVTDNSVVVINFFLRFLVIWMIEKIGYNTRSKETSRIMVLVFIIQTQTN